MNLLIILACLIVPFIAGANDLTQPHETWGQPKNKKQTMPHYPPQKTTSNKRVVNIGSFISYQVNTDQNEQNIVGDAANEPSIAVNPLNPDQIVIGWRQFNNVGSDFREAGLSYSHDGGLTWNNIGPLEPGVFRSDPVLAANADGVFYYQSLAVEDNNGQPGLQDDDVFRVDQWRSINGGMTWIDKTNAIGGDKSWYAIDHTNSENRGNIYAAWNLAGNNHFPSTFNYSVNNGMTYTSPETLPKAPVFGTVAVGFDGEVYIAGQYFSDTLSYNYLVKSQNPTAVMFPDFQQETELDLGGQLKIGGINPAGLLGQVWVATDTSNRHTRGNVYVAASIAPFGLDPLDFNFIRSRDGGNTFSQFISINDDDNSFVDWSWFGTMGVAPNGRIDMIWLDTRNAPVSFGTKFFSELFYSYSYDGGVTFSKNQIISPLFNHSSGYPVQQKMGDYIDIVSDNRGAHVAYTATFTGGQDVYYIHAKPAAYEENPYFPSHEMDGIWHNPAVPRQGVLSKTLVPDISSQFPQLINFEAVFTETPDGTPTWMVLQNEHPIESDSMTFTVLYPTGDLSADGIALRPIGLATKSRRFDSEGELIKNSLQYDFDMTDAVTEQVSAMSNDATFDLSFYQNNPFYQTQKTTVLNPLVPTEQPSNLHCLPQNLVFENPNEKAEGRVPVTYQINDRTQLFIADFTYLKTTSDNGSQQIVLNNQGLAQPTWQVTNLQSGDLTTNTAIINDIYSPKGGNGFFNETSNDPGVDLVATETLSFNNNFQINGVNSSGAEETYNTVALNSYCGELTE